MTTRKSLSLLPRTPPSRLPANLRVFPPSSEGTGVDHHPAKFVPPRCGASQQARTENVAHNYSIYASPTYAANCERCQTDLTTVVTGSIAFTVASTAVSRESIPRPHTPHAIQLAPRSVRGEEEAAGEYDATRALASAIATTGRMTQRREVLRKEGLDAWHVYLTT